MGLGMERRGCDVGRIVEADDMSGMCMGYESYDITRDVHRTRARLIYAL
jgi:hypothetical protein